MPSDDDIVVKVIANAPEIEQPLDSEIPNDYQFEIFRLKRRVAELEIIVLDKDTRIRRSLTMIEDELLFWRTGILDHVWEKMGAIQKRIVRLEATLTYLRDIQPHNVPRLEPPVAWKKKH